MSERFLAGGVNTAALQGLGNQFLVGPPAPKPSDADEVLRQLILAHQALTDKTTTEPTDKTKPRPPPQGDALMRQLLGNVIGLKGPHWSW